MLPNIGSDICLKAGECPLPFISTLQLNAWLETLMVMIIGIAGEVITQVPSRESTVKTDLMI